MCTVSLFSNILYTLIISAVRSTDWTYVACKGRIITKQGNGTDVEVTTDLGIMSDLSRHLTGRTKGIRQNLNNDSRSQDRDLNPAPSTHTAGAAYIS
jgi:hypothetical protein